MKELHTELERQRLEELCVIPEKQREEWATVMEWMPRRRR